MNNESAINKSISNNRDYSISFVRLIAMIFIFICHVMQQDNFHSTIKGAEISWDYWFAVGVQMFLFISGFLYGKKDKINIVEFYSKSMPKLLVNYYVFISVMLGVICFSPLMSITAEKVFKLLTFSGTVPGLGHLWFIPIILFCYLMLPIFSAIIKAMDKHRNFRFFIESIILIIIVHLVVKLFFSGFSPAWINCFVFGMLYGKSEKRKSINTLFIIMTIIACLIFLPIQFKIDYWYKGELPGFISYRYSLLTQYGKVFLGIFLVIILRFIYNKFFVNHSSHYILNWSDKYSYDFYLVHHIFVQSAFSIVNFISNRFIAIPLALALTIISSILLCQVSDLIRKTSVSIYRKLPN